MFCSYPNGDILRVFTNNGSGFSETQVLAYPSQIYKFDIDENGTKIYMVGNGFIRIYNLTNSTFEIGYSQVLANHTVIGFWFSQDEQTLICSMDFEVHIMEFDGSTYQTIEILSGLSGLARAIRPSEDRSELYIGLESNEFLVYENNGGHSLRQTMAVSFGPMQICLVHGLIQINGQGSEILFL